MISLHRNAVIPFAWIAVALGLAWEMPAQLPPVPVPAENPITEEKRVLGKILFWEEQLSSDNTVACGTCHIMAFAGSDPRPAINPGIDGTFGNADDAAWTHNWNSCSRANRAVSAIDSTGVVARPKVSTSS